MTEIVLREVALDSTRGAYKLYGVLAGGGIKYKLVVCCWWVEVLVGVAALNDILSRYFQLCVVSFVGVGDTKCLFGLVL